MQAITVKRKYIKSNLIAQIEAAVDECNEKSGSTARSEYHFRFKEKKLISVSVVAFYGAGLNH